MTVLPAGRKAIVFALSLCLLLPLRAQTGFETYDFKPADSVASLYPGHRLTNLKSLSDKLTTPLVSEVDKFRAIYQWACSNIENDYGFYAKNKSKRERLQNNPEKLRQWNEKFRPKVFRRLVDEHKTVCTGYAYLIKELAFHADIKCELINGYGRTPHANIGDPGIPNHSWNAVRLNGRWYLCDPTWSSGVIDAQKKMFLRQPDDAYFLADPAIFVRNHYPLDTSWILLKDKPTLSSFLNGPLIYRGALTRNVAPVFPETFEITAIKGEEQTFRFSSHEAPDDLELQIREGTEAVRTFYPEVHLQGNGMYYISHVFSHRGTKVVHLLIKGEPVFTYSVSVSGRK